MNHHNFKILLLSLSACFLSLAGKGQNIQENQPVISTDSMDLQGILRQVTGTHPAILKAMEGIQSAEAGIGLSRSTYYPMISGQASYTRIGPIPDITIENLGSIQMAPGNVLNGSVDISQVIYDFAKTARNVRLAESSRDISEKNVDLVKEKLTLLTAVSYYSLVYIQEAIKIKDIQLGTLNNHLDFVNRKKETGSATQYEILTTQVRISTAENQKFDLLKSKKTLWGVLNALLGNPVGAALSVKNNYGLEEPVFRSDSLVNYALEHRNEMLLAHLFEKYAVLNLDAVKIQNNPVLGAYGSGGLKNGYFPDLEMPRPNFAVGIGIRVPIFDATRHKYNVRIASSQINTTKFETESVKREISAEVNENEAGLNTSKEKIKQCELQVRQAEEALNLAQVNYSIGAITNLDLLDAETSAADSRLSLLKARVDLAISIVRLDISLGKPVK